MVRFKKRYIVIEVSLHRNVEHDGKVLRGSILNRVKYLHGEFGLAAVERGFHVKYTNDATNVAILSAGRSSIQLIASSLPFITHVRNKPAKIKTLNIAASMKHALLFIKKHHEKALRSSQDAEES